MANESRSVGYYAVIPVKILLDESIQPKARLLFGIISNLCNQRGYCFASNQYLSEATGWHNSTVSDFINQLIKAGYLSREDKPNKTGTERRLFLTEGVSPNDEGGFRQMTKGGFAK